LNAIPPSSNHRRFARAAILGSAASVCLLALAGPAAAQVAGWTQFQGGAEHAGAVAAAAGPPFATEWIASTPLAGPGGRYGLSAAVLAGDQAVTVAPEHVLGFDLATGESSFSVVRAFGPPAPPAIGEVAGRQVVLFTEGFAGSEPGASPSTPTPAASSPAPSAGPVDSHLAAFDLRTQKPLWDPVQLDDVSKTGVTVAGGLALVGTDAGTIYAIDLATGSIAWKVGVGGELLSSVAAAGDLVVAGVAGDARAAPAVVALDRSDGSQAWSFKPPAAGLVSGIAIAEGRAFAGFTDTTVRAIDLRGGTEVWSARLNAPLYPQAGPATSGGAVYALDVNGQLYRLDVADGARTWDFALNAVTPRGWPVVEGDHVLIATDEGRLVAIRTTDGHLEWDSGDGSGPLRWLVPTPERILGVRGGPEAGLEAFANDPSGALVDVVSPTVADPAIIVRNFAVVAVPFVVLVLLAGNMLGRRLGPAFILVDDDGEPEG
jgi:outer membrane protein assembly factor BamB